MYKSDAIFVDVNNASGFNYILWTGIFDIILWHVCYKIILAEGHGRWYFWTKFRRALIEIVCTIITIQTIKYFPRF